LVKADPETEGGNCIRAEALKAEIEIARFSWGADSIESAPNARREIAYQLRFVP
jgi:hypothetical protein